MCGNNALVTSWLAGGLAHRADEIVAPSKKSHTHTHEPALSLENATNNGAVRI